MKGDPRRVVLCREVEARVFGGEEEDWRREGRKNERKKKKRKHEEKGEWRSVDMEDRSTIGNAYGNQDYGDGGWTISIRIRMKSPAYASIFPTPLLFFRFRISFPPP